MSTNALQMFSVMSVKNFMRCKVNSSCCELQSVTKTGIIKCPMLWNNKVTLKMCLIILTAQSGADAINKFTPSLGIPYLGV